MEEADLLKERLQAITDKRRIQEDIVKKRRQIEEDKLKLQYIKKKTLREQWLMDGLSQQSGEEQEAMRLQVQDEQQQSDQLQTDIDRMEKEIGALETEELNISANEEFVLKRLKEVERTAEDIIKALDAEFHTDTTQACSLTLPQDRLASQQPPAKSPNTDKEAKIAAFAMEISVERDKRTGDCQVVSTATVSTENIKQRGLKVYDDGRKSIYAMNPDGGKLHAEVAHMTTRQAEELLRQATDENIPSEVQYHHPVYSSARPKTPNKVRSQNSLHHISQPNHEQVDLNIHGKTLNGEEVEQPNFHFQGKSKPLRPQIQDLNHAVLVSITARSEEKPKAIQPVSEGMDGSGPSLIEVDCLTKSFDNVTSANLVNTLPQEPDSAPVTMIFMGYENALDDQEEDFQAELVVVGNSDDDDDGAQSDNKRGFLSYHPEGYKSKVYQPEDWLKTSVSTNWNHSGLHRPTFTHKSHKENTAPV
ncbi:palmdelphin isoform X3 [Dunckerocampus dactyliophorus]|uniref:palmdelphin isoform X3 n=1 Tax=Dunckerocampus dactyliophorus TaxID=161453 RepID=UPI0024049552|nr:palmdelphin isoform X3 [Dunckerocampus dactyliophorus]